MLFMYFLDHFDFELLFGQRTPTTQQEKSLLQIFNRVNDVFTVLERLDRYGIYFESFYPDPSLISEAEAIEYHLHNYIQDTYSLKEKISKLIGCIKNDLPHFEIANPEDVKALLDHLKAQIESGLKKTITLRHKHVHDLSVRDLEISQAKALKQVINSPQVDAQKAEKRYGELVKSARNKFVAQADNNKVEFRKMKIFFVSRLGFVVASLYRHDTKLFERMISEER